MLMVWGLLRPLRGSRNAGDLAPGAEGGVACGAVLVSGQAMAAELEVVVDPAVNGQEAPGMARRLEPLHLPFSSSCRLVRHLGPVVEVTALAVLHAWQDLALRGGVAPELVSDDYTRDVLQALQQLAKESLGCLGAAPALDEDVEHVAVLIGRAQEVMQLAPDADEHLIQKPFVASVLHGPGGNRGRFPGEMVALRAVA